MKSGSTFPLLFTAFLLVAISAQAQAPAPEATLTSEQIIEKATPSLALVLVGKTPSELDGAGSAIVVRENGILLTAYHLVKGAQVVQVRFRNGEVFDSVQLLAVDRRRDVAAIRIHATALPALPLASAGKTKAGDPIWAVSNVAALPWAASTGIIS